MYRVEVGNTSVRMGKAPYAIKDECEHDCGRSGRHEGHPSVRTSGDKQDFKYHNAAQPG